jgi:hypothetical protein
VVVSAAWGFAAGIALSGLAALVVWLVTRDMLGPGMERAVEHVRKIQDKSVLRMAREAIGWKFFVALTLGGAAGAVCFYGLSKAANGRAARLAGWGWPAVAGGGWWLLYLVHSLTHYGRVGWWSYLVAGGLVGACAGPLVMAFTHALDWLDHTSPPSEPRPK